MSTYFFFFSLTKIISEQLSCNKPALHASGQPYMHRFHTLAIYTPWVHTLAIYTCTSWRYFVDFCYFLQIVYTHLLEIFCGLLFFLQIVTTSGICSCTHEFQSLREILYFVTAYIALIPYLDTLLFSKVLFPTTLHHGGYCEAFLDCCPCSKHFDFRIFYLGWVSCRNFDRAMQSFFPQWLFDEVARFMVSRIEVNLIKQMMLPIVGPN